MRVAIIAESFLPNVNGVTNSVLRVTEHLKRSGHQAIVIAPDTVRGQHPAALEHEGTPVHRVPSMMVPKISSLPVGIPQTGIVRVLRNFSPDVVHLASPFVLGAGGLLAAKKLHIPTVAVYQTDVAGFAESYGLGKASHAAWAWTRKLHRGCDRTLAPSSSAVKALENNGIPRVHRWARGVDVTRFAPSRRRAELRQKWSTNSALIVGFVGRLAPEKHVERLAVLAGRPDVQLVIVGAGSQRAKLEELMPGAVFTGELGGDRLAEAYASFDVFVHPGEHETFCQSIQEALASGIPVVGPNAGGPQDLVGYGYGGVGRNGYLLEVAEFTAHLPAMIDMLKDAGQRALLAENARRSVLGRTWGSICSELIDHYCAVQGAASWSGQRNRTA
ncbi:MAG: glycosyltransferase family 4 protein [Mycobacteriaceae bacterium]